MKKDDIAVVEQDPVQTREGDTEEAILEQARKRAKIAYEYHQENLDRAENNVEFIFGNQYTSEELQEMDEDNRLAMVFNKLPQFINNVVGSQRASVRSIKVTPTGSTSDQDEPELESTTGKKIKLSKVLTDLIRDIEYQCNADAWYKIAFKHALEGGFGYLRVLTDYQDCGFDLDIKIKAIRNRWSVLTDPHAQEADKSDMNWAFIYDRIPREEFRERYPDAQEMEFDGANVDEGTFWGDEDTVTIAEYFRREPYERKLLLLSDGTTHYEDEIKDVLDELEKQDITIEKERKVVAYKVIWSKITGASTLEKEKEFPTSTIPIIPVIGREIDTRRKKKTKGLIDDAKDAQMALNRMRSSSLERIDTSPLAPWVATDKAIEGYEEMWAEANSVKYSTLVYRKGETPPQRDMGATMPVAELQMASVLDEDMKASIGMYNSALGSTSNEISGKAIRARQAEADVGTYEFIDNYNNAIRRVGILISEMIPVVYDTNRIIRVREASGETDTIEINKVIRDTQTGKDVVVHDLSLGKHTVVISTGASYETQREENADQILQLMQVNPQVGQVGSDLLVKNLDFADSDVLAERLEKTIPPQFLSKEKQDELAKDAPPPTPSTEQIKAEADMQSKQMDMDMKKIELEYQIQLENIKLQTAQTNLQIKQLDLGAKNGTVIRDELANENQRRDNIAKEIADRIIAENQGGEQEVVEKPQEIKEEI